MRPAVLWRRPLPCSVTPSGG
ncbi:MAG: hypothetical protein IM486_22740 [Microcystis sp. M114S2]|nr:hypothetical protein [Microcystis sp. M045S2]MCA2712164.1 hypothetical protein [Microcystis sp. M172S2]MCA2806727.1 hypothetical protein [Microcystis sp. M114S2]MCA2832292.1 hypothetical protein [Microcystis sp. M007S1]MCA2839770.1 hypothetical protein [Microcystis sp. M078S1]MCA2840620.1 hypothetical protein [Microcystis sp. M079S1]MCA2848515.1 hypothetical protein [Microcystis sp. M074S1]